MDGSKADDRKGGGSEQETPRAPRSVREGLGGERGRRRPGKRGRRGRHGPARNGRDGVSPPPESPVPTPAARISATSREVEVDGVLWRAQVVGAGGSPGGPDRSVRLLEVTLEAAEGPSGSGYVAGVDLDGVDHDELVRLVRRLSRAGTAPETRSAKRPAARGRGTGSKS